MMMNVKLLQRIYFQVSKTKNHANSSKGETIPYEQADGETSFLDRYEKELNVEVVDLFNNLKVVEVAVLAIHTTYNVGVRVKTVVIESQWTREIAWDEWRQAVQDAVHDTTVACGRRWEKIKQSAGDAIYRVEQDGPLSHQPTDNNGTALADVSVPIAATMAATTAAASASVVCGADSSHADDTFTDFHFLLSMEYRHVLT